MMIQLSPDFNSFVFLSFLRGRNLKVVHFISKPPCGGVGSCTVYKGSCTWSVLEVVQFIREVVQFGIFFITSILINITRHTFKKTSITTSLYHVQLWYIKPYKGVQLPPSKLYKITSHKWELINFDL